MAQMWQGLISSDVLFCPACRCWQRRKNGGMRYCDGSVAPDGWCGACYSNVRGRSNKAGHAGYHRPAPKVRESCHMPLKKPSANGSGGSGQTVAASSEGFLRSYRSLTDFLSCMSWEDGSRRQLGTLLITVSGSQWSVKVRDPNGARYAFFTASTLEDALAGVDLGIEQDSLDWRPEKPFQAQQRK